MATKLKRQKVKPPQLRDTHPWVLQILPFHPIMNPPKKMKSMRACKSYLHAQITDFGYTEMIYDKTVSERCARIHEAIDAIEPPGGSVDEMIDPRSGLHFRAEIRLA